MNDTLTDNEITQITGVQARAHNRVERISRILNMAGIYFWLSEKGTVTTTWTHVHRAGLDNTENPNVKMPHFQKVS